MTTPATVRYNESVRAVLREVSDFGFASFDLVAPPRRLLGDVLMPLIEPNVDVRRVSNLPTPASLFERLPEGENWLGVTQRTLARLQAAFLVAEDPQRRLDARKAATLTHQVSLVQHVFENPNLRRVLIADEVGLGKTIEAGLLVKRLVDERPNLRVLYLAPARLVNNVAFEFRDKLELDARCWIAGSFGDARLQGDRIVIASMQKAVFGDNFLRVVESGPWDVIVVDECHHLSDWGVDGGKPNQSFRLVNQLVEKLASDGRVVIMSGTPHQGSETRFKNLLRLLGDGKDLGSASGRVIFRTKDRVRDWSGKPLFPSRDVRPPTVVQLGGAYELWYESVAALYDSSVMGSAQARARAAGWAKGQALQWAASSVQAGLGYLTRLGLRRLRWTLQNESLKGALAALRPYRGGSPNEPLSSLFDRLLRQIGSQVQMEDVLGDDEDLDEGEWRPDPQSLEELLDAGVALLRSPAADAKWRALSPIIDEAAGERIVLFAQPVETVGVVAAFLERQYGQHPSIIIGDQSEEERRAQVAAFQSDGGPQFLVSSRAGGEGLNMQRARRLIHLDVPWNPMEMEQRVGRVHRFGSRKTIVVDTVVAAGSREVDMYRIAREKLKLIARQLDPEQFESLFSRVMSLVPPKEFEEILSDLSAGPLPDSASNEIGRIVTQGYESWRDFDDKYRVSAEEIRVVNAGEASWADVESFLIKQCGAEIGPDASLTSFNFENDEIVPVDDSISTVRFEGQLYACGDTGGTPVDAVAGHAINQLGLNLPVIARQLHRAFMPERLCGAGYLKCPENLDVRQPKGKSFGVLFFLRQMVRQELGRPSEGLLSLHAYGTAEGHPIWELNRDERTTLIRHLLTATRVRDPIAAGIEPTLGAIEERLAGELRRPSDDDISAQNRYVVWPIATIIMT